MRTEAKYYIYRNLHTDNGFSVKHRGKVVAVVYTAMVEDPVFKVNESGRQRVLRERRKNVHAFIVSATPPREISVADDLKALILRNPRRVHYNPYEGAEFKVDHKPLVSAPVVVLQDGCCWVPTTS